MITTYLVKGDSTPVHFTLYDEDDELVDLSGATITFSLRKLREGTVVLADAACVITNAAGGECEWRRTTAQPTAVGEFEGELQVTYPGGSVKHYPDQAGTWLFVVREAIS